MSTLTLQLGQCGNQLGHVTADTLFSEAMNAQDDLHDRIVNQYFHERKTHSSPHQYDARTILIDMEPKVINNLLPYQYSNNIYSSNASVNRQHSTWAYNQESVISDQWGSANNWAYGYHRHGTMKAQRILDTIHTSIERMDTLNHLQLFLSLAGGTGSGLGAYTLELLRNNFPRTAISSHCIFPFTSGEISVQWYNSLLSLSHISEYSDVCYMYENDRFLRMHDYLSSISGQKKEKDKDRREKAFDPVNKLIARSIVACQLPIRSTSSGSSFTCGLSNLMREVGTHPSYRLLTIRHIPQTLARSNNAVSHWEDDIQLLSWNPLFEQMNRLYLRKSILNCENSFGYQEWNTVKKTKQGYSSHLASLESEKALISENLFPLDTRKNSAYKSFFLLRGNDLSTVLDAVPAIFSSPHICKYQNLNNKSCFAFDKHKLANKNKTLTMVSSCQTPFFAIQHMLKKANEMFNNRIYLHQYHDYGIRDEDFAYASKVVLQMCHDYANLSPI